MSVLPAARAALGPLSLHAFPKRTPQAVLGRAREIDGLHEGLASAR